jgi:hypothetical protein
MPIPVTTVRGSTTSGSRFTFREEQATIWSRFWVIRPHEEKCTLIVVFDGMMSLPRIQCRTITGKGQEPAARL